MEEALNQLGSTIGTINTKVQSIQKRSTEYKSNIKNKLRQILSQLQNLKNNPKLANIRETQNLLARTQQELAAKTQELAQANEKLAEMNNQQQELQNRLQEVSNELEEKKQEFENAQMTSEQNEANQRALNEELNKLKEEKAQLEQQLNVIQQQQTNLIDRIAQINGVLVNQISTIDSLANELPDNDFAEEFQSIASNIQAIVNILNANPNEPGNPNVNYNYTTNPMLRRGGKRSKKVTKKRKQRGGYTYLEDASLKKQSSVISNSFSSKSMSKSKNKKNTRKTKRRL